MSPLVHALLAGWVVVMLLMGGLAPERYGALLEEDRIVEWGTFWVFLAAAVLGIHRAVRERRVFDGLVGLFCLFVAGEEISWGQRLLGFYSPEYFLVNNFQQEVSLHNLTQWAVQPKWFLMAALAAYGMMLPVFLRQRSIRPLLTRVSASGPPTALIPWFVIAIVLLWWYPYDFTGEWVELQAGMLFFASTKPDPKWLWGGLSLATAGAVVTMSIAGSVERRSDAAGVACAEAETRSLLSDLLSGGAALDKLWNYGRVHKRVWTAVEEDYIAAGRLRPFAASACQGGAAQRVELRRKYGIDPWGTAYWFLMEKNDSGGHVLAVYSFGPNRRRDGQFEAGALAAGDDVAASAIQRISATPVTSP